MTASDIITDSLLEINVLSAGDTPSAGDAQYALRKLNRIFDDWNAEDLFIYGTLLFQGTLKASHNPHTIGLASTTPDFTVTVGRPSKIMDANLVLTDVTPNIFRPLKVVDEDWWMNNPVPTLETQIPYYLYPNFGWPQGQLYLWPVPTKAYDIRLNLWTLFSQLGLADTFDMPPGYQNAVMLTLAEQLAGPFGMPMPQMLPKLAAEARARVKSMNSEAPTMACDGAVQSMDSRPRASIANFLSGFFN